MKKKLNLPGGLPPPTRLRSASPGRRPAVPPPPLARSASYRRPAACRLRASRRPRRRPAAPRRRLAAPPAAGPVGIRSSRRGPTGMHLEQRNGERTGRERERKEREVGSARSRCGKRDSEGGALGAHVTVMKKNRPLTPKLTVECKIIIGLTTQRA